MNYPTNGRTDAHAAPLSATTIDGAIQFVPEPGAVWLSGGALLLVAGLVRRRSGR